MPNVDGAFQSEVSVLHQVAAVESAEALGLAGSGRSCSELHGVHGK